ncbi:clostripain [Bacteroidia bacterium]|nr:clostripain [Bacteroidia bacterium]GHT45084.1 clostripain [Bacteroidia bacterium]
MGNRRLIYGIVFFSCILYGCGQDEPYLDKIPASTQRTVLLYLGVDNNFRAEAAKKIEILRENWDKNTDGNLLVYSDAGGNAALIHLYYNPQKGNVADTIITYPDENSASPQTLTRVLNDVKNYRPANSYGLVVLSHATGWLPAEMSKPTPALRSIIWDTGTSEANNYMELTAFAEAIPYRLDFIIFDACFMGAVEVAYELKDKADYIVASPAEVVSPGFVYSTMAQRLFQPQPDLTAVARDFYEYFNNQSGLYRSATVSVVKTAELENLKTLFQGIAGQARNDTGFQDLQCFGYGSQKIYFDLGDCIQKFAPEKYNDFQTALDRCVLYKAATDSYYSAGVATLKPIHTFCGLSVYVPQEAYPAANMRYGQLKWNQ